MSESHSRELNEAQLARRSEQVQASPEFQQLKRRFIRFIFPLTAFFLAWYLLYVLLASYAPGFFTTPVFGNINVGMIFGLLQFVSTFTITTIYARWADRTYDPAAAKLRKEMEEGKL